VPLGLSAFSFSEDPAHPVRTCLLRIFVGCFNDFETALLELSKLVETDQTEDPGAASDTDRLIKHINERIQVMVELTPWLFGNRLPRNGIEAFRYAQAWSDHPEEALALFEGLQRRRVGSPNKNATYLRLFELMLESKTMSLGRARQELSPKLPRENEPSLKAGIRKVKRLLRKHAPEFVARYESLHPDRAQKVNG